MPCSNVQNHPKITSIFPHNEIHFTPPYFMLSWLRTLVMLCASGCPVQGTNDSHASVEAPRGQQLLRDLPQEHEDARAGSSDALSSQSDCRLLVMHVIHVIHKDIVMSQNAMPATHMSA